MKNISTYILSILAALPLLAGCAKDNATTGATREVKVSEITFSATIADEGKVSGVDDPALSAIKPEWVVGDKVFGYYVTPGSDEKIPVDFSVTAIDEASGVAMLDAVLAQKTGVLPTGTTFNLFYAPEASATDTDGAVSLDWSAQDGTLATLLARKAYMVSEAAALTASGNIGLVFHNVTSIVKMSGLLKKDGVSPIPAGTQIRVSALEGLAASGKLTAAGYTDLEAGSITVTAQDGPTYVAIPRTDADIASFGISYSATEGGQTSEFFWLASAKFKSSDHTAFTITGKTLSSRVYNGHEYVDLGLTDDEGKPLYFAKMNIGATAEGDKGLYFQWGNTTPVFEVTWTGVTAGKEKYLLSSPVNSGMLWTMYPYSSFTGTAPSADDSNGYKKLTKYTLTEYYLDKSVCPTPDGKTVLEPEDDAATALWGGRWRMPTMAEMLKLNSIAQEGRQPETVKTSNNADSFGVRYTANGETLFLPGTGRFKYVGGFTATFEANYGKYLIYWTSELDHGREGALDYCARSTYSSGNSGKVEEQTTIISDPSYSAYRRAWLLAIRPVFTGE